MAFETGKLNLFGLDLSRAWMTFSTGWAEALRWRMFSWLNPDQSVRLLCPDGTVEWRKGASARIASGGSDASPVAVLLPDDIVLFRELILPDLLPDDVAKAAALDVELNSPFPGSELTWGIRPTLTRDGQLHVRVALASRNHVAAYLESRQLDSGNVEVWAGEGEPVVLTGYQEVRREQALRRRRQGIMAASAVLVALLLVLAATPWYIQRARVFDAQNRHAVLEAAVAPVVADREALVRSSAQLRAIGSHLRTEADALSVLSRLTALLPDNAHLTRLEVNGVHVRFAGIAVNAANLVEALGRQEGFGDVKTPTAISRTSDGRESFTVELTMQSGDGTS